MSEIKDWSSSFTVYQNISISIGGELPKQLELVAPKIRSLMVGVTQPHSCGSNLSIARELFEYFSVLKNI